jgi:GNAT superfamily N-acetyltransferase
MTRNIVLRGLQVGDIGWVAHRQGILYAQEYGWDATFEAMVADIAAQYVKNLDPEKENAWIAECEGRVVGSVFVVKVSDTEAKLRLLYVEPEMRGTGLGRRLTQTCIAFAKERGYQTLSLWTNDILHAAKHIYQTTGFVLLSEEPHQSFGHDLVGQYWTLDLGTKSEKETA